MAGESGTSELLSLAIKINISQLSLEYGYALLDRLSRHAARDLPELIRYVTLRLNPAVPER